MDLNGRFSLSLRLRQYKVLIPLQLLDAFNLVRHCLLTVAEDIIFNILMPSWDADVLDAWVHCIVDRRDADISLPCRFWLLQYVRHSFILLLPGTRRS